MAPPTRSLRQVIGPCVASVSGSTSIADPPSHSANMRPPSLTTAVFAVFMSSLLRMRPRAGNRRAGGAELEAARLLLLRELRGGDHARRMRDLAVTEPPRLQHAVTVEPVLITQVAAIEPRRPVAIQNAGQTTGPAPLDGRLGGTQRFDSDRLPAGQPRLARQARRRIAQGQWAPASRRAEILACRAAAMAPSSKPCVNERRCMAHLSAGGW